MMNQFLLTKLKQIKSLRTGDVVKALTNREG